MKYSYQSDIFYVRRSSEKLTEVSPPYPESWREGYLSKLFPKVMRGLPGCEIIQQSIMVDHIHLVMVIPPRYSLSDVTWGSATAGRVDDSPIDEAASGATHWQSKRLADLPTLLLIPIVFNNSAFNGLLDVAYGDSGPNNY